ncbi:MAG: hypothetical protein EXS50_03705 [Candidatus Taylorbacteria bacterium]|nr:hypothetical protein [Candidatus Taylorbacteria bacterium]
MDILEKIFGSETKVRLMRLFMFNPNSAFDVEDISSRTNTTSRSIKRELVNLKKMGLIKKKFPGWTLNQKFQYLNPLQDFLLYMNPFQHNELVDKLKKVGNIKFLAISGIFIQEGESRVDLLVVGDHIKTGSLEKVIRALEAELGKELKYAAFETEDFRYRLNMCDKLVSDVLDYPHERVINKLGIE